MYEHLSAQPLVEIARSCLSVSNNFIANQLALTAGAQHFGAPATWEKGRQLLTHFARNRIGIAKNELEVVEGSGLSRQTRITPIAMLKILRAFEPYRELLPEKNGAQLKSGTMNNVFCYAGYLDTPEGNVLFVLMLNQPENTRSLLLSSLTKQFGPTAEVAPATVKTSTKQI
jgi:D-alanyl-D-alanine carboxypeptidase/D-alanyl-D-alanine-endopeptidase (penicillin-binding protein 4)